MLHRNQQDWGIFLVSAGAVDSFHGWKYIWIINKTNLEIWNLHNCDKITPRYIYLVHNRLVSRFWKLIQSKWEHETERAASLQFTGCKYGTVAMLSRLTPDHYQQLPWSPVHCSRGDWRATCYPGIMALRSQEWSGGGHAMLTQHRRFPQFDISMGTGKWAEKMPQFRADAEFFIRRVWHLTNNAEFMEYNSNVQEQAIRTFLCEHIKT